MNEIESKWNIDGAVSQKKKEKRVWTREKERENNQNGNEIEWQGNLLRQTEMPSVKAHTFIDIVTFSILVAAVCLIHTYFVVNVVAISHFIYTFLLLLLLLSSSKIKVWDWTRRNHHFLFFSFHGMACPICIRFWRLTSIQI